MTEDKPRVLNPWEELAQVQRPSIFMKDPYFRAKNPSNQIKKEEDLGYKQFGTFFFSQWRLFGQLVAQVLQLLLQAACRHGVLPWVIVRLTDLARGRKVLHAFRLIQARRLCLLWIKHEALIQLAFWRLFRAFRPCGGAD